MGVAQGMKHARHRVVGLPVVMHHNADHIGQQAAASGADAIEGEPGGTSHMQPLGLAADPKACLVHVLDRRTGYQVAHRGDESCSRAAQVRLIRAMVAATNLMPNRSAIRSSGSN